MIRNLFKTGHSIATVIPKHLVKKFDLHPTDRVNVTGSADHIEIRKIMLPQDIKNMEDKR